MDSEFKKFMQNIVEDDVKGLEEAEKSYGDSWKKRGGVGAYMMMVRKSDRMDVAAKKHGYDIFKAVAVDRRPEGTIDDIRDLRRYLLLVETELAMQGVVSLGDHRDNVVDELNDIKDKEAVLEKSKEFACYIELVVQPPEWATVAIKTSDGWVWQHSKNDKQWPVFEKGVICNFRRCDHLLIQGVNHTIQHTHAPVFKDNLWKWELTVSPVGSNKVEEGAS